MSDDAQRIIARKRGRLVHVETPLAIINIYHHLTDDQGRRVERVEIIPNDYAGEPKVTVEGSCSFRIVEDKSKEEA